MSKFLAYGLAAIVLVFAALPVNATVEIGQPAPEIEATDTNGNAFKLSDHKGKIVVLEWTNHQCPFVMKHYDSGNMQAMQKAAQKKGVEWISIISSAPGRQGHVSAEEANKIVSDSGATITAKILDETGTIGKAYDAKTTPHMFVIDAEGNVAYAGAIDSQPSPNPATIEGATNYVNAAIDALEAGQPVEVAQTQPYGCSVKY
ncbi:MAG: thioredoxin family protein [Alphaproteobacteria bacterium]|nr:thioredoxin family protein [Alphaproteobacteria bacterium]